MAELLRRVGRSIWRNVNVFAVVYFAGLLVMVADTGANEPQGWAIARAFTWVIGAPLLVAIAIYEGRGR